VFLTGSPGLFQKPREKKRGPRKINDGARNEAAHSLFLLCESESSEDSVCVVRGWLFGESVPVSTPEVLFEIQICAGIWNLERTYKIPAHSNSHMDVRVIGHPIPFSNKENREVKAGRKRGTEDSRER
jgi:hypothetical protein